MSSHRGIARSALLSALGVGVLALSACGSSSPTTAASSANAQDTARLKLQQCLRDNGVNLPAPGQTGEGGGFRNLDRQKLQKAMQGPCKKLRTAAFGTITPQQRQAFQDAFVKFSACMRQNGVNVPTPNFNAGPGGGAGGGGAGTQTRRINRNDPKTQAALKKCQSSLPNGGRGGPGGGVRVFGGPGGPPPGQ